jgi:hypothetical protein
MKRSMRQRGSAWELRVHLGADGVTGAQRSATKTVRAGEREAQRLLNGDRALPDPTTNPTTPKSAEPCYGGDSEFHYG